MNLERHRIDRLTDEEIICELKEVAKHYDFFKFTRHVFDDVARTCKGTAVISRFGTWARALARTELDNLQALCQKCNWGKGDRDI